MLWMGRAGVSGGTMLWMGRAGVSGGTSSRHAPTSAMPLQRPVALVPGRALCYHLAPWCQAAVKMLSEHLAAFLGDWGHGWA